MVFLFLFSEYTVLSGHPSTWSVIDHNICKVRLAYKHLEVFHYKTRYEAE